MLKQKIAQRKPKPADLSPVTQGALPARSSRFEPSPLSHVSQVSHDAFATLAPEIAVQAKLTVNTPGDAYEREADAVAESVVAQSESETANAEATQETHASNAPTEHQSPVGSDPVQQKPVIGPIRPFIQRQETPDTGPISEETPAISASETMEGSGEIQRLEGGKTSGDDVSRRTDISGIVATGLSGGGKPLDSATRSFMEPRFGHDFSGVRIHNDTRASQSASAIAARAYTTGTDVAFQDSEYNPGTDSGKQLLAHELTHVIQQGGVAPGKVSRSSEKPASASGHGATAMLDRPAQTIQRKHSAPAASVMEAHHSTSTPHHHKAPHGQSPNANHTSLMPAPDTVSDKNASTSSETAAFSEQAPATEHEAKTNGHASSSKLLVSAPLPPNGSQPGAGAAPRGDDHPRGGKAVHTSHAKRGRDSHGSPSDGKDGQAHGQPDHQDHPTAHGKNGSDVVGANKSAAGVSGETADLSGHGAATDRKEHHGKAGAGHGHQTFQADAGASGGGSESELDGVATAPAGGQASPRSPQEDPGFQAVVAKAKGITKSEHAQTPAQAKSAEAQAAASGPPNQITSAAGAGQVGKMAQEQPKPFDRAAFVASVKARVADIAPKNLAEADDFKSNNTLGAIKGELSGKISQGEDQASSGVKEKAKEAPSAAGIQPKAVTPIPPQTNTPQPTLSAAGATPKPKTEAETSLQAGGQQIDAQMSSAHVTDDQLEKSHEPNFETALDAKAKAKSDATKSPGTFRHQEQAILGQSKTTAQTATDVQLTALHGEHADHMKQVSGQQGETKSKDEQKRAEIATYIEGVYQRTKEAVEKRLARLDTDVDKAFTQGADEAKAAFEDHCEKCMDAYKDERYSGARGKLRWVEDKFTGLPDEVNQFYVEGRQLYITKMSGVLDGIAAIVDLGLTDAKAEIARGEQEIQQYVTALPKSLQQIGQEAAQNIQDKFSELARSVDAKKDALIDSLSQKYSDSLKQVDDRIDAMKSANWGLVDAAMDAIGGVIKTILEMKAMLSNVLAQAGDAIDKIILDPISFLGNLGASVKLGFNNFVGNIGTHLKNGLMGWLVGTLAEAGIAMPDSFDLKGIFTLTMEVLGLTYPAIRARAVGILGEKTVRRMEKTESALQKLATEGISGIWAMISEKLSDLQSLILYPIESFVKEKIIVAGVMWVVSLLNPASAFVKACKAIYDIVMFFIERGSQIVALVQAITGSISAIASGAIGGAAAFIEQALARAVPVVIGFLASLLGMGGISEKIQSVITKVRAPIEKAIDWVIQEAYNLVKSAIGLFTGDGKDGEKKDEVEGEKTEIGDKKNEAKTADNSSDKRTVDEKQADLDKGLREATQLLQSGDVIESEVTEKLPAIQSKHQLVSLELVIEQTGEDSDQVHVTGKVNPTGQTPSAKAEKSAVKNALKKWQPRRMQFGSSTFILDKKGMKHILERHHPEFWDGSIKQKQTFLQAKMKIEEIANTIESIMQSKRELMISKGTNATFQITASGYTVGINNGRVGQFYGS